MSDYKNLEPIFFFFLITEYKKTYICPYLPIETDRVCLIKRSGFFLLKISQSKKIQANLFQASVLYWTCPCSSHYFLAALSTMHTSHHLPYRPVLPKGRSVCTSLLSPSIGGDKMLCPLAAHRRSQFITLPQPCCSAELTEA